MFKNRKGSPNKNGLPNKKELPKYIIAALIITLVINIVINLISQSNHKQIDYSEFLTMVNNKQVESVEIYSDKLVITPKSDEDASAINKKLYYTGNLDYPQLVDKLYNADVKFTTPVKNTQSPIIGFILSWIIPFAIFYMLGNWFMKSLSNKIGGGGGGFMSVGKSNAKVYVEKATGVSFKDVAGQEEAKESLKEIVDFLHKPERYTKIGAKLPKGALLVGPPGTGKTLLAKAVAGEAKVPFFSLSGSGFVEMFVGVGASRVRDLFAQAEKQAPCIIFIDEIDAIGKSREGNISGNDEREQTLNQLLAEMDGFDSSKGVVILAATNRPEVLDKALLRPGRFDRRVIVDKPDLKGRENILKVHSKNIIMDESVNLKEIALATAGAVGADLANMVNEAALRAVRMGRDTVRQDDLFEAVETVIAGKEKKDRVMTENEKSLVAFHEVGHALASALQKKTQPVHKITIVPRTMGALGYTMQMPEEEKYLMSKDELLEQIVVLLAGRAAEDLVFNEITTGASNDIERATSIARQMVTMYGMSEKFGMIGLESIQNRYLDGRPVRNCSDEISAEVDREVMNIINESYEKAKNLLKANMEALGKISSHLIFKETIMGDEFMEILNSVQIDGSVNV
ncbi:ATP-dependent zinc metalloprotease FtsH [Clostridium beijerinckii]|jgi:membrane protease FtsH catalytic subunit (EC 3.4.24.-)|uniref:ATP-dependent zinc metalloprotease FtsH n=2 Tax=Clostridium beijerinckii TaxID=1520 RepID=A0AAE2UYZ6_CLOBE|nr:ATP-dependent zinc metalloprotease FtsH [Clostridium beijerinckii]ABR35176.1 ATP-dependent metalloprotease FtsH [Clostridium beijerinckii NCIMB 8052]AIU01230.1 ATP-dependent metalloprotease FtsH [Clostridium beijerinckii ATCC 35702]MBF7810190.1 ATP-dependent zinc metalloprotease FtsH [Clostridium beijerinckii]NOW90832.1 cell division protease FtsH [Clostridium beijerinckii]NRT23433.1 cell division protease FtsH [Clostridium beijerinckii]